MISLDKLWADAQAMIAGRDEGRPLDPMTEALVQLAVHASATSLDTAGIDSYIAKALEAGATAAQIQDTLMIISALGVHTLMEGAPRLARQLRASGDVGMTGPLNEQQKALWEKYIGDDPYWAAMEQEVPDFLDSLLRLSPHAFEAFFQYCAVPWKSKALPLLTKELISLAADATPTHRYLPGFRLHLANALKLGAGRRAILQTLDIAAHAPLHQGVP